MNWFDIVLIAFLSLGVLLGIRRGFVRQLIGLSGLIAAFVVGFLMMDRSGEWFNINAGVPAEYASLVGFAAVFLGVQLIAIILSHIFDRIVRNIFVIGVLNRLLGGGLGLITTALFSSLLLYLLAIPGAPSTEVRTSSLLYEMVYQFLPQSWDLATQYFPQLSELSEYFPDWL